MSWVIVIDNLCFRNSLLLFLRKSGADKIIACIINPAAAAGILLRTVPVEPTAHGALFPCNAFQIRMILKYIQILIGKQEQLPAGVGQHPPFDGVYIIIRILSIFVGCVRLDPVHAFRAVRLCAAGTALLIGAKINVVCLPAADICGGSAVHKLDRLAGVNSRCSSFLNGESNLCKGAGIIGLVVAVILLAEHIKGITSGRKVGRNGKGRRSAFSVRLRHSAIILCAVFVRNDNGDIFIFSGGRPGVIERNGIAGLAAGGCYCYAEIAAFV